MPTVKSRVAYAVASVLMSMVLSCGFVVWYVTQQNQQWCTTLNILTRTDPRTQLPPSTPAGKQARPEQVETYDALVHLKQKYHCGVKS